MKKIDLSGKWGFCLDDKKEGVNKEFFNKYFEDSIELPATVATAKKGKPSAESRSNSLTDPYYFEGYTWYSREIEVTAEEGEEIFLLLERTRISHVWVDSHYVGMNNSLCTSHRYKLTSHLNGKVKLTIMIDNTSYPVKGGHMTSPDTQTNWNGITGEICLEETAAVNLSRIRIYPEAAKKQIMIRAVLKGIRNGKIEVNILDGEKMLRMEEYPIAEGENVLMYQTEDTVELWNEHAPKLYLLQLVLKTPSGECIEKYNVKFGFRNFKAQGKHFEINGVRTFLRGKHDGLLFPLTGYAATDVESWLKLLNVAKQYGINHYRFHTCCPPEAAFLAADILGIYMEPELPFWGTITGEGEEGYDQAAQQYLVEEGFRILDEFGNHPSFVMMSLGNELWGSRKRLNEILAGFHKYDSRHLYTQGSNNFQFAPCILEEEDFFCGVRFSKDRLIRGSYAMCDAPQGHIQTKPPSSVYNYDEMIRPANATEKMEEGGVRTIQFGTGVKQVKMEASGDLFPEIPVISHEIGQYAMFPDFSEIDKYQGVLKARNLEEFQKRLKEQGMLSKADAFFHASGSLAVECYKQEIETALRSKELAGFQILDIQDFMGQGTALVGILNSFMENKGLISEKEWRSFCSEDVLLAEFPGRIFQSGQKIKIGFKLSTYSMKTIINPEVILTFYSKEEKILSAVKSTTGNFSSGLYQLNELEIELPETQYPEKFMMKMEIKGQAIENSYSIWIYPEHTPTIENDTIRITSNIYEACEALENGERVVLIPADLNSHNSIEGAYCTDFWCYPMFRNISETMKKKEPVGTHGLLIDNTNNMFRYFPTETYSTPQWYDLVTHSRTLILDNHDIDPVVWTIDNFQRNHKLGNIVEIKVGKGKLLICTFDLWGSRKSIPAKWLSYSLLAYVGSDAFEPLKEMGPEELVDIF